MKKLFFVQSFLIFIFGFFAYSSDMQIVIEQAREHLSQESVLSFSELPDSSQVRMRLLDSVFFADIHTWVSLQEKKYSDANGSHFLVYVEKKADEYFALHIVPLNAVPYSDSELPQGTWIVYRNQNDGALAKVEIVLRAKESLVLALRPPSNSLETDRTYIDMCLYNTIVRKDISLGVSFKTALTMSLPQMRKMTARVIPWDLCEPKPVYATVMQMSKETARNLHCVVPLSDGAFDADGKAVHISNGSPQTDMEISQVHEKNQIKVRGGVSEAGFLKWIIDGMIFPIAGQGVYIDSLKRPTNVPVNYFTIPHIKSRDPFFGLNWIRNLAAAALSLRLGRTVYPDDSGVDVTVEPFSLSRGLLSKSGVFLGYQKNIGYRVDFFDSLLYYLAIKEPGHFYLATVSREVGTPRLREYQDLLVFFPYFTDAGVFKLDIYQGTKIISMHEFMSRYAGEFAFLVRVAASENGLYRP